MKRILSSLLLLSTLIFSYNCTNPNDKEVSAIDSLAKEIAEMEAMMVKLDLIIMVDSIDRYEKSRYDKLVTHKIIDKDKWIDSMLSEFNNKGFLKEYQKELDIIQNMDDQEFLLYYKWKKMYYYLTLDEDE